MPQKLMRDLILEAFGNREQVNFTHIMDYCLAHSIELRVPLSPILHRDEILFRLLNDIDDLEAEGLIRVYRYRGFIQSMRRIHAMSGMR